MRERLGFCTFTLDRQLFGVDVQRVQEVLRHQPVTRFPWTSPAVQGLLNLRGHIVTVVDLRPVLGLAPRPVESTPENIVVRSGGRPVCLWVDEIGEVIEVSSTDFESVPTRQGVAGHEWIRGVYRLEDRMLLTLDVPGILRGALA